MEKYNPQEIEKRWQKRWESSGIYNAKDGKGKKYYSLFEFPYPSADGLHVGHPRPYIGMDVISRKRRMEGYNVLFPIGWDAFGLPTENYAIKNGIDPAVATKKSIDNFRRQLKSIALSVDWTREINTTDPEYYKWTQWMFLKFFEKGMAYKAKTFINWCPKDKIGLANEEAAGGVCDRCGGPVEKREKEQWMLRITKYADRLLEGLKDVNYIPQAKIQQENWIGRSEGAEIEFSITSGLSSRATTRDPVRMDSGSVAGMTIKIFTTRPDTIFGATYLVLAPEHPFVLDQIRSTKSEIRNKSEIEKYLNSAKKETDRESLFSSSQEHENKKISGVELQGIKAINPATKEEIPVWVADYVLSQYGTGAIMAVPAHDERDYAFAKKYNLPIKQVIAPHHIDSENPPRKGKKDTKRNIIHAIVKHPAENKIITLKWNDFNWKTFVTGGIEEGETPVQAAAREVLEETGFKNIRSTKVLPYQIFAEFYAAHKDVNRAVMTSVVLVQLENLDQAEISAEEQKLHRAEWVDVSELATFAPVAEISHVIKWFKEGDTVYTGDGVLMNSGDFSGTDSEKAKAQIIKAVGGVPKVQYKLRDWVFSRQRYWGEPIPLIYCPSCANKSTARINADDTRTNAEKNEGERQNPGWFAMAEKDLPLKLPKVEKYQPTDTGESPLANIEKWVNVKCPKCKGSAKRETDTMPNWAGSSWYFLAYCMPEQLTIDTKQLTGENPLSRQWSAVKSQKLLEAWLPVAWYNGGMEHTVLHLLYSRFWNMFLYDLGLVPTSEPYKKRTSHGLILAEGGVKMSKSKGNVVNPDDLVKEFGADALRVYEMFMGPFEQAIAWDSKGILGAERFLKKVWNIGTMTVNAGERIKNQELGIKNKLEGKTEDRELITLLHKTIKKVSEDIEKMAFNTAISSLMVFVNKCDEYRSIDSETIWKPFLQILAPFAPHLSEELYQFLGNSKSEVRNSKQFNSIHTESWPEYDPKLIVEDTFELVIQVNGKVRGKISAPMGITQADAEQLALANREVKKWVSNAPKKIIYIKNRLINFII